MPKKKKEITLEEIARLTQDGFEAVDGKLDAAEARLAHLENRMATKNDIGESEERLLHAIQGIEIRRPEFETLQDDVEDLGKRVDFLEKRL